jgi:prevent-host-death family protein
MEVAVRDLKAKLSSYLRRAAAGELITVTDRGKPVATLGPLLGKMDLSDAVAEGWVTAASATGLRPVRRHRSVRRTEDVLDEDRRD